MQNKEMSNPNPSLILFFWVKNTFHRVSVGVAAQHLLFPLRHFIPEMSPLPCPLPLHGSGGPIMPEEAERSPRTVLLWDWEVVPCSDKRQWPCEAAGTAVGLPEATFLQWTMTPITVEGAKDEHQTQSRSPPWGLRARPERRTSLLPDSWTVTEPFPTM